MSDYVVWLNELGMHDVERVGGKNASLGEMIRNLTDLGVRVPGGFATTAHAYREFHDQWTGWFEGLKITLEDNGDTLLTGPVVDQAASFGLLKKVRDLGLPLVSINCVEPGCPDVTEVKL